MKKKPYYGIWLGAAALFGGISMAAVPVLAQTSNTPANASPNTTGPNGVPAENAPTTTPPSAQPAPAPASPFAAVTAFGQDLANKGVFLSLSYTEDVTGLVAGGTKTGVLPTGELAFGTVLDLQKLAGITGASLHIIFDERNGEAINGNVGTQGPLQANSGPTRAIRLSEFYWEQGFDSDRLDLVVGRTNPTLDFATSDISCQFVASVICAQPGTWYFSNANEAYPASTWGGRFNFLMVPDVYIRAGAYDDDPSQLNPNQQGFNWNVHGSTGVFVPAEVGYSTSFAETQYPSKYDVGGYYDDATYSTPAGVPMKNRTAVYAQAQQTIWRPNRATNQSLTVFAGGIVYNGGAPYWSQFYAGALDRGPFLQRPNDTVAVIMSYYANSSNEVPNKPQQWILEANYGFVPITGVTIKPYVQWVGAPNNFLAPAGTKEPDNAWVLGVQFALDVGALFHMPQFIPY
jgi:porin